MTGERWRRLEEQFARLVDRPPEEQEAELAALRGEDSELAGELARLLRSSERSTEVLASAIGEAALGVGRAAAAGDRIGPYRLRRELGRGGMGAVYLAERADGRFEQQVAIKLVPAGASSPRIVERFRAERRILAQLEHPHIARLLDGGATDDGRPYFVMEHVEGEPIDAYCDRLALSTRERLELFRAVCAGVEAAHRRLVVHRDLKPSNILVTAEGVPKLLDFGIAKLLEPEEVATGVAMTRAGERVMTPEYASPEQVRAEPVSTATDVYALGLLLYELLTGRRAHRLTSYAPREVERVVCETPPERPSTVVTRDPADSPLAAAGSGAATPEEVSRARGTVPLKLKRRLSGDLDNILMMALRKEPERRYSSVEQLSEDVRRHLDGLPVLAHADSLGYRARKFVRRNRARLAAAAAVLVLVVSLVGYYTLRLAAERDWARQEAATAEAVSGFLEDLFKISDPGESRGNSVTAREMLDSGFARIESELAGQPAIQARLIHTMGSVYLSLGLYDEAEAALAKAVERRERLLGPADPDTLRSRNMLGTVYWRQGRYAEAEAHSRGAYEQARRVLGPEDPETLTFRNNLGLAVWRQGRFEEAEQIHREIVEARKTSGVVDTDLVGSLNNLAGVYWMQGRLEDAARLYGEALETGREVQGEDHPGTLDAMNNLAMTYDRLGRFEESSRLYEEVVALRRRVLGEDHPRTLASQHNLANMFAWIGRLDDAESLLRPTLEGRREVLGPDHPATLASTRSLAEVLKDQGRLEEAERRQRQALEVSRRVLGEVHVDSVGALRELAGILRARGKRSEAERAYHQALSLFDGESRPGAYAKVTIQRDLAELLLEDERQHEAEPLLAEAAALLRDELAQERFLKGSTYLAYGRCLSALGRQEEAAAMLRAASESLEGFGPRGDRLLGQALEALVAVQESLGNAAAAAAWRVRLGSIAKTAVD